jgi:hypothetical protein
MGIRVGFAGSVDPEPGRSERARLVLLILIAEFFGMASETQDSERWNLLLLGLGVFLIAGGPSTLTFLGSREYGSRDGRLLTQPKGPAEVSTRCTKYGQYCRFCL